MTQLALRRTWLDDPHSTNDFVVVIASTKKILARIRQEARSDYRKV